VLDGDVFFQTETVHETVDTLSAEDAEEVVLQRDDELAHTRVALTARAPPKLVVDPSGLMAFGAQNEKSAGFHDAFAQFDVGAPARHVGGDGNRSRLPSLRDDRGLFGVLLGVQDLVRKAPVLQHLRQTLRLLHRDGAHQDRLASLVAPADDVHRRLELRLLGLVDEVVAVLTDHRLVGRDDHHFHLVDLTELIGLRGGGAGHAGDLLVETEVVLQGDGGERLVLFFDPDALLGLDGLVQTLRVAPALEDTPGELVDDLDFAVLDQVVDVALEERGRPQSLHEVVDELARQVLVDVVYAQLALDAGQTLLGYGDGAFLLVDLVVFVLARLQPPGDAGEVVVRLCRPFPRAGDDERGPGLVDEDGVNLVHDAVVMPALHLLVESKHHVVTQIVEAELGVGAVSDVGLIRRAPLGRLHAVLQGRHRQAQEFVYGPHPGRVAAGQVIVHRDHMHSPPGQGVEVYRHGGDEGLAFPGLHLGNRALMKDDRTHHLNIERAHAGGPSSRFADDRERFRHQVVERLAGLVAPLELVGLGT